MPSVLRRPPFWLQIVTGLVLGVVLGLVARTWSVEWLATGLDTVGGVFVGLLKAAVPPLVFTAIVVSIANLRQVANAARLATQTLRLVHDHLADRGDDRPRARPAHQPRADRRRRPPRARRTTAPPAPGWTS